MHPFTSALLGLTLASSTSWSLAQTAAAPKAAPTQAAQTLHSVSAQLGPRPFFLLDDLADGPLKQSLQQCARA